MANRILIVDDDVDSLKLIGLMLQRHGYEVTTVNRGSEALAHVDNSRPDLIILDVMMPDMNGLDVSRRLRSNPDTSDIPIIMFTAKTLIDDKVKGFEAGADDYLTKPTHPAELAARVQAMLDQRQAKAIAAAAPLGTAVGVLGSKGGVGTTTVAINLAAAMLQAGSSPLLADFCPGYGIIGTMLGMKTQGMAKALHEQLRTPSDLEGELVTHESGLRTLLSTPNPQEGRIEVVADVAGEIAQSMKQMSQQCIFDLGHSLTPLNEQVIRKVDYLLVTIEATPISMYMAALLLDQIEPIIERKSIGIVVVQRSHSSLQTPWPEIENRLKSEVLAIIAAAPDLTLRSMQQKTPLVLLEPQARVAGQFVKLADDLKQRIGTTP